MDNENLISGNDEWFVKIPNVYVHGETGITNRLNRKLMIVYILLYKYRPVSGILNLSIGEVFEYWGNKVPKTKNKTKAFDDALLIFKFLETKEVIKIHTDMTSIGYHTAINIEIIKDNFGSGNNFTVLTSNEISTILNDNTNNKEYMYYLFTYVKSYIYIRKVNDNKKTTSHTNTNPESFFRSYSAISKDINMSKNTINKLMEELVNIGLLVRQTLKFLDYTDSLGHGYNIPYIYVLNNEKYQQEIDYTVTKLKEYYGKDLVRYKTERLKSKNRTINEDT